VTGGRYSPLSMPFFRALTLVAAIAAVVPAAASASEVRFAARGEPVHLARLAAGRMSPELATRPAPFRFNMVGLHWKGSGDVWFRTALERGEWSEWQPARPEDEDTPDVGSAEAAPSAGWKLGNPYWTGTARFIEYRFDGRVVRLRAHFLWSEPARMTLSSARAAAPTIIRRSQWGADESIVRAPPWYADRLRLAIVHHTAGTNDYSAAQSAAIVRGIQAYHVLGNGWNDIGYNFLVDKYGQVFEGRGGGINQNVGGAHAQGFNTGSTGVAVLGTYSGRDITTATRSSLVKLISWRLDVAHVDPRTTLTFVSYGSDRFAAGTPVRLRAVSGHRDTAFTSCPGAVLYGRLGEIAKAAAARGLPKLYEPVIRGSLGGPVRITGRLSSALPWTVAIHDAAGAEVARGTGSGTAVDWTWNASAVYFGDYTYTITSDSHVRPASGRVPGPPPLAVTNLATRKSVLTPNGDGVADKMRISFGLTTPATVDVTVLDSAGNVVATPADERPLGAGSSTVVWDGMGSGVLVPDGHYTVRVLARSPAQEASASRAIVVDRTLGFLTVSPSAFSPNGDGRLDVVEVGFDLTRSAEVQARVMAGTKTVAQVAAGSFDAGHQELVWNGLGSTGPFPDGIYRAVVQATTTLGTRELRYSFGLDTTRPVVKILSARRTDGRTVVRFWLSESAVVNVRFDDVVVRVERKAGTVRVSRRLAAERVQLRAWDAAANPSRRKSAVVTAG
jgi:hypothetical protein